ncbi:MAG: D-2-hydroxyacid dehydrogenase [Parasporobacterium sp.]|nr:D-2-hydroxyacid dehydrogenase [Parasporobacterium sp.]
MKIVVLDTNTLTRNDMDFSCIDRLGETAYYNILTPEEIKDRCRDAEVLLINKAFMSEDVIDALPKLRYIGLFATGYNNVDLDAANRRGIAVVNVPGYSTDSVAQHVFAFILTFASNLPDYNAAVHRGEWINSDTFSFFPYPIMELAGKTLGIVGYGNIGRKVASIADAFGMKVLVSGRRMHTDCPYDQVDPEQLFRESDFLTLHCPLNADSERLVNETTLKRMKPTAYLINTSRGGVVDSKALADALQRHQIAGAGIDVLPIEPMPADDPLLKAPNCLITPHIGWASLESRTRCIRIVGENLRSWMEGHPVNLVKGK